MLKVEKVQYLINWKGFEKGASFFIPCLDPVKSKKVIVRETCTRKYTVTTKVVIEDDVRGIRVWRV
jgi:hypothetical protein